MRSNSILDICLANDSYEAIKAGGTARKAESWAQ